MLGLIERISGAAGALGSALNPEAFRHFSKSGYCWEEFLRAVVGPAELEELRLLVRGIEELGDRAATAEEFTSGHELADISLRALEAARALWHALQALLGGAALAAGADLRLEDFVSLACTPDDAEADLTRLDDAVHFVNLTAVRHYRAVRKRAGNELRLDLPKPFGATLREVASLLGIDLSTQSLDKLRKQVERGKVPGVTRAEDPRGYRVDPIQFRHNGAK